MKQDHPGKAGLSEKQRRFVAEYLIDLNATQAAIRAGYSKKTANQIGPRLLVNVGIAEAIREGQEKKLAKAELKAEEVINGIRSVIRHCEIPGKQFNPQAALRGYELLGRHLRMFTDKMEMEVPEVQEMIQQFMEKTEERKEQNELTSAPHPESIQ